MARNTKVQRVYISQVVRIHQLWVRKRDRITFRIYQIHRKDHRVDLVPVGLHDPPTGKDVTRESFSDLRSKYRQVEETQG